jgi:sulfoquinovose isomerase
MNSFNDHVFALPDDLTNSGSTTYGKDFLIEQVHSLLNFAKGAYQSNGGFGYLDSTGVVDPAKPREAYIQCRMTQVFALSHGLGLTDERDLISHGVKSLNDLFKDSQFGGFFNSIDQYGNPISKVKLGYDHFFVLLAATSAMKIGIPGAGELFENIDAIVDKYFWNDEYEMMNNSWDLEFKNLNPYQGINANMHAVEALTAAYDVTKNSKFHDRAMEITSRTINVFARNNGWMLPEHFNSHWKPDLNFNISNPADPFCPYGVTIGHLFEWSRLTIQLHLQIPNPTPRHDWMLEAAKNLYQTAKKYGWEVDAHPGFVYTVDWDGKPVVSARMHWVAAEAVMAAYVLWKVTGSDEYLGDYDIWWRYIDHYVLDKINGSWHHELDQSLTVSSGTWSGKPDVYHAFNAVLLPLIPMNPSFIGSLI